MISRLEGVVLDVSDKYIIVGVGGVGFKVFATFETKEVSHKGKHISLFTHLVVREDALDLYGFLSAEELAFFELLISISGVGPKTALGILNVNSVSFLKRAIAGGKASELTKISGIGKKVAEKLILELKDKIDISADNGLQEEIDVIEALVALGYSQKQAREALADTDAHATAEVRVKAALKVLSRS